MLIVATILILEYRRWMWLLPPMFLFWANCHGGFFMGFVVLGAYCAESLWQRFRGKPEADERRLWLVTAVCVPAAFLNPNGFLTLYILLAYKQSSLMSTIYEWQKPALWPPSFLNLLLLAAAAVLVWQRRRTRLVDWLLLGLFGAAYFSAVRNSNLVGLVAPVLIASLPAVEARSAAVDGLGRRRASGGRHRGPVRARARLPTALCRVEISRGRRRFSAGAPHHAAHVPHLRKGRLPDVALLARRALLHRWTLPQ